MKRLMILLALGCSAIGIAGAQSLELVEGAAELELSDVTFPDDPFGSVIFTSCETCEPRVMPVDANTIYIGASGPVSLDGFLDEVAGLRATAEGQDAFVGLFYNLSNNRVSRIRLYPQD